MQKIVLIVLLMTVNSISHSVQSIVVPDPQGGRLGNSIMNYAHAQYFAYLYHLELVYHPFAYSARLMLSENARVYTPQLANQYKNIIHIKRGTTFDPKSFEKNDTIYRIQWFAPFPYEGGWSYAPYSVDWNDKDFLEILRQNIKPRDPGIYEAVKILKDKISVAVHVRKGGGIDPPLISKAIRSIYRYVYQKARVYADKMWPQKFPPDSYYIEQIQRVSKILGNPPLRIYLFTDDKDPGKIAEKYRNILRNLDIEFVYREEENSHNRNILEDLFAMLRCDCLIIPASAYSYIIARIGDHRITIWPKSHLWENGKLIINEVNIIQR